MPSGPLDTRTALWRTTAGDLAAHVRDRVVWFGREAIYVAPAGVTPGPSEAWTPLSTDTNTSWLHLVVDKRGAFAAEHSDIPTLYENGRYSIVSMDPATAQLVHSSAYVVRPLRVPSAAFSVIERPATVTPVSSMVRLVDQVSEACLKEAIEALVAFETRESTTPEFHRAVEWALDRFDRMGFRNRQVQAIDIEGQPSANVIVTVRGTGPTPRESVIVTAHLDSIGTREGQPAPGADDNASGVAGLIELARCLAGRRPESDLVFILFGGEEQTRRGSRQYVTSKLMASHVRGVVNMDMIGSNTCTNVPTMMIEGTDLSRWMIDGVVAAAHTYTNLEVQVGTDAQVTSDNTTFDHESIAAILLIEGNGPRNRNIHGPRDTIDRIDFTLARDIVRANLAFVAAASRIPV
jgi:hypothetical protein